MFHVKTIQLGYPSGPCKPVWQMPGTWWSKIPPAIHSGPRRVQVCCHDLRLPTDPSERLGFLGRGSPKKVGKQIFLFQIIWYFYGIYMGVYRYFFTQNPWVCFFSYSMMFHWYFPCRFNACSQASTLAAAPKSSTTRPAPSWEEEASWVFLHRKDTVETSHTWKQPKVQIPDESMVEWECLV